MGHRPDLDRPDDACVVVATDHNQRGLGRSLVDPARRVGRFRLRKLNVDEHDVRIGPVDG
jgi:hypothetical protein